MSAQSDWPRTVLFYCDIPAPVGKPGRSGETPIADTRRICDRLASTTRSRFAESGLRYVRNIERTSFEFVFGTADHATIAAYCAAHSYELTFDANGNARTEHRARAIHDHPVSGEKVWFNQAQSYHLRSLPRALVNRQLGLRNHDPLPLEVYYGDGTEIDRGVMTEIRRAYESEKRTFLWQRGDILLLDNMLVAHGRRPYEGERRVLVAHGNAYSRFMQIQRGAASGHPHGA
jgi:hypothetical protein